MTALLCIVGKNVLCVKLGFLQLVDYTLDVVDFTDFEFDRENATCRHIADRNWFILEVSWL